MLATAARYRAPRPPEDVLALRREPTVNPDLPRVPTTVRVDRVGAAASLDQTHAHGSTLPLGRQPPMAKDL